MLIDDDDPGRSLGDDVVFMQLRPGRAKGMLLVRLRLLLPDGGEGRAMGRLGKAGGLEGEGTGKAGLAGAIHLIDRTEGLQGSLADGRRRSMPRTRQGRFQRCDDEGSCGVRLAEPHLGLCRVDVHINPLRISDQIQDRRRVPVAGKHVEIRSAKGTVKHPVQHWATVDEHILLCRRPARIGRQGGIAL